MKRLYFRMLVGTVLTLCIWIVVLSIYINHQRNQITTLQNTDSIMLDTQGLYAQILAKMNGLEFFDEDIHIRDMQALSRLDSLKLNAF